VQVAPYAAYHRPAFEPVQDLAIYPDQEGWYFHFSVPYELTAIAVLGLTHCNSALEAGLNNYWGTENTVHLLLAQPPRVIYSARVEALLKIADLADPGQFTEVSIGTGFDITELIVDGVPYPEGDGPGTYRTAPPDRLILNPATGLNSSSLIQVKGFQKLVPDRPIARTCIFSFPQFYHCDYLEWIGHTFTEVQSPLNPAPFSLCWNPLLRFATLYLPPALQIPRRSQTRIESAVSSSAWTAEIPRPWTNSGEWVYPTPSIGLVKDPVLVVQAAAESAIKLFTSVLLKFTPAGESGVWISLGRALVSSIGSESGASSAIARTLRSLVGSESGASSAIGRVLNSSIGSESAANLPIFSQRIVESLVGAETAASLLVGYGFRISIGSESAIEIAITRTLTSSIASESASLITLPRILPGEVGSESGVSSAIARTLSNSIGSESGMSLSLARVASVAASAESAAQGAIGRVTQAMVGSESYVSIASLRGDLSALYAIARARSSQLTPKDAAVYMDAAGSLESALSIVPDL
jgi:hypothetical protein